MPTISTGTSTSTTTTTTIRSTHPGNCPKCGMTLEPVMPSLDDEANPDLADLTHRFWWTLPLTVIVAVLAMFGHQSGWIVGTHQPHVFWRRRWDSNPRTSHPVVSFQD